MSDNEKKWAAPLAERMRPKDLDGFLGQDHILGPGKMLRESIEKDSFPSPPGEIVRIRVPFFRAPRMMAAV